MNSRTVIVVLLALASLGSAACGAKSSLDDAVGGEGTYGTRGADSGTGKSGAPLTANAIYVRPYCYGISDDYLELTVIAPGGSVDCASGSIGKPPVTALMRGLALSAGASATFVPSADEVSLCGAAGCASPSEGSVGIDGLDGTTIVGHYDFIDAEGATVRGSFRALACPPTPCH